jgi:hypothetical protein
VDDSQPRGTAPLEQFLFKIKAVKAGPGNWEIMGKISVSREKSGSGKRNFPQGEIKRLPVHGIFSTYCGIHRIGWDSLPLLHQWMTVLD